MKNIDFANRISEKYDLEKNEVIKDIQSFLALIHQKIIESLLKNA